jgi:hypothetical protein
MNYELELMVVARKGGWGWGSKLKHFIRNFRLLLLVLVVR